MKKKIFITGASGFLGYNLILQSVNKGYEVIGLINNRKPPDYIKDISFKKIIGDISFIHKFDNELNNCHSIIHTAAKFNNDSNIEKINIDATIALYKAAIKKRVKQFIYISTRGTIGISVDRFLSDEDSTNFENIEYSDNYIKTKIIAEKEIIKLSKNSSTKLLILCPTAIIGPNDLSPTPIGWLINHFNHKRLIFFIDGYINLIDVRDIAELCVQIMEKTPVSGKYGIGNTNIAISNLIDLIKSKKNEKYIKISINYKFALFISHVLNKFLRFGKFVELIDPYRILRLKEGYSCFNSQKAKNEISLKCRNIVETINDTI